MNINLTQEELELQYSKEGIQPYLTKLISKYKFLEVCEIINNIKDYLNEDHDYNYHVNGELRQRNDLIIAHEALQKTNLDNLVWKALTFIVSFNEAKVTHQAVVGMIIGAFKDVEMTYHKLKACEIILTYLAELDFLETSHDGDYFYWRSAIGISDTTPLKRMSYVLPSIRKLLPVTSNSEIGYNTFKESVISGGNLKHHEGDIGLDDINRKNSIAYCYETRLHLLTNPVFNHEPKLRKDGNYEDVFDVQERKKAFDRLHNELPERVALMTSLGNKFYLAHKRDCRLRTYVKAHHFNYQSTKYLKAMVQFANKETSTGEW